MAVNDPNAVFHPGQWESIDALVNQRRKLLVVQRTGWGERVTTPDEIRPALECAFGSGKAALLDVVIDPDVAYAAMGGRSRQSRQY